MLLACALLITRRNERQMLYYVVGVILRMLFIKPGKQDIYMTQNGGKSEHAVFIFRCSLAFVKDYLQLSQGNTE